MLYVKMRRLIAAWLGRTGFIVVLILTCFAITVPGIAFAQGDGRYGREDNKESRGYDNGYSGGNDYCAHTHYVEAGENLTHIADRYGVPVDMLAHANGVSDADYIQEGQKLCIPSYSGHDGYGNDGYGGHDDRMGGSARWSDGGDNGYGDNGYGKDSYGGDRYGDNHQGYGNDGYGKDSYGNNGYGDDHSRMYGSSEWSDNGYGDNGYGGNGYGGNGYGDNHQGYGDDRYGTQDDHGMSDAEYSRMYGSVRWSDEHDDENGNGDHNGDDNHNGYDRYGKDGYGKDSYKGYGDPQHNGGNGGGWD